MDEAKPFKIPKREIWEAFKRVKANQGAVGVDGQSIAAFEANLSGNLYKPWNRMSSGSYFPPPVRRVDIPKAGGGTRQRGERLVCTVGSCESEALRSLAAMSCKWPNNGSRMNREVHVRFWESPGVKVLRATRPQPPVSLDRAGRAAIRGITDQSGFRR